MGSIKNINKSDLTEIHETADFNDNDSDIEESEILSLEENDEDQRSKP